MPTFHVYKNLHCYDTNSDIHSINTRNRNNLVLPRCRLQKVMVLLSDEVCVFFNKVPADIRDLPLNKFKNIVKNTLINKAYSVGDYLNDNNAW